jgi:hypothetical protein
MSVIALQLVGVERRGRKREMRHVRTRGRDENISPRDGAGFAG